MYEEGEFPSNGNLPYIIVRLCIWFCLRSQLYISIHERKEHGGPESQYTIIETSVSLNTL